MNSLVHNNYYDVVAPNICPYCYVTQICTEVGCSQKHSSKESLISLWRCTNMSCQRLIVCENELIGAEFVFIRFLDSCPQERIWPEPVLQLKSAGDSTLESKFIKTYNQSVQAENAGLDEIAGMGYRKSIEYLVKDLATAKFPNDIEKIKGKALAQVLKDYFTGDIKDILERAVWLGNDHAHYYKIFEQFDLTMLKDLIDYVLAELDKEYKKAHYLNSIKPYNKP
ncbi:DUF4145 domain-containing protein [Flavobacterium sp. Sd200]|uniref:DUF4145 domain-containing protein n=1 Tax=Flavobacterium sp. Sd200 TaxID=2692211 RepID=UPI00136D2F2E|nr:DUF4145 domain-containing protein [Flavobacterium sp. Sd200]MXN90193.1 DUF4145 domain-containing protein [Flavobacterium sp. Sd200]